MYTIKKFNNISDEIYKSLPEEKYNFITDDSNYDAALVRSANLIEEKFPENLLAIARAGVGINNIPVDRCSEEGIVVFSTPGANANAVKEMVILGMLLGGRKIIPSVKWVEAQGENVAKDMEKIKKNFVGAEIQGKTLGVIGLGAIGSMIANIAIRLGMNVVAYDPYLSVKIALSLNNKIRVMPSNLDVFKEADYITFHIHETPETRGMINEELISNMKDGVVILNYARGGIVNEDDMVVAVTSGKVGRYVTDFPSVKYKGIDNIIATPHLGASTPEAEENCAKMAAAQLANFLETGAIHNSVNMPETELPDWSGPRIAIINKNVTNMLGKMGSVLAEGGYNIEHMVNHGKGDYAYTVFDLNKEADEKLIEALKAVEGIVTARIVK